MIKLVDATSNSQVYRREKKECISVHREHWNPSLWKIERRQIINARDIKQAKLKNMHTCHTVFMEAHMWGVSVRNKAQEYYNKNHNSCEGDQIYGHHPGLSSKVMDW